jgi:dihydroxyacetone kinase-like protein
MFTLSLAKDWIFAISKILEENKSYLTELDSAIGDADHGVNICRGFAAAAGSIEKDDPLDLTALFKTVSIALIKNTGGASGPLYGTFFLRLGTALKGTGVSPAEFCNALSLAIDGVMQLGHSKPGEKTMIDALAPALKAAREAADGEDFKALALCMFTAAKDGAEATVPMLATKGRASYLGERSIGHLDPGAASTSLIFQTLSELSR